MCHLGGLLEGMLEALRAPCLSARVRMGDAETYLGLSLIRR